MAGIDDYKAKDIMTKNLVAVRKDETLSQAMGIMKNRGISEVLIKDEKDEVVGMVTQEMFTQRRHLPLSTKLENVMNSPPSVQTEDNVMDICEMLMSAGYRGIPVKSSKGKIVGFVSRTDIVKKIPEMKEFKDLKVNEIMTPAPSTITEHDSIDLAKNMMRDLDEKVLPVVNKQGKLSGMIGIKDMIKSDLYPYIREEKGDMTGERDSPHRKIEIRSLMNSPPITTTPDEDSIEAARKMAENDISTLIALDEYGDIKGVLTSIDLIETLASFKEGERVYVQITGLNEGPDTLDMMYELIQKYLQKFNNVIKPLVMNIHVVTHNKEGTETKFSLRMRLQSDHGMFYVKEHDWNIMRALNEGLDNMERIIFEEKERHLDRIRKHPKYRGQ